ncbi:type IV pilin protein [Candidatus Avelusimicrobium caledoniensis]|uniref:type IV pilin protein n=1 Tax=Candidatus Avelusimicrobium caledoniensis TaxID=3416220 RepID=UPI003D0AB168
MKNINKNKCHPELDSGSLLISNFKRGEIPNQVWNDSILYNNKAFTLIELLVVVLIIGILAAVALPQYQKAVEKARMTEAVSLVRAIANANQVFYMANGRYADMTELSLLDIEIPGDSFASTAYPGRIETKNFIYSPGGNNVNYLALAQRKPFNTRYYIYIAQSDAGRVRCTAHATYNATAVQRKLCEELDAKGTL